MGADESAAGDIARYSFLKVFANDRTIDEKELGFLTRLALRDGVVDEKEKRILGRIFRRVKDRELDPEVRKQMEAFKEEHDIR